MLGVCRAVILAINESLRLQKRTGRGQDSMQQETPLSIALLFCRMARRAFEVSLPVGFCAQLFLIVF